MVGVSRVFANGKLRSWRSEGILSHCIGRLTVRDVAALRTIAGADAQQRGTTYGLATPLRAIRHVVAKERSNTTVSIESGEV